MSTRSLVAMGVSAMCGALLIPQLSAQQSPGGPPAWTHGAQVVAAVHHDVSPPLRSIPVQAVREEEGDRAVHAPGLLRRPPAKRPSLDPQRQEALPAALIAAPTVNFDGVSNLDGVLPPDTNGDIGPNHYVQWVNLSFAVYSRSGQLLYGPARGNTIFSGFGGPCQSTNHGDPIVLYDELDDRWLLTQFALPNYPNGPFYQCIAISTGADPTGSYYRYAFQFDKMNDYPKFGVWPDGYYMAINQFAAGTGSWAGQGVAVFDRTRMLNGQSATAIKFDLYATDPNLGGMLPSDLDGTAPPAGAPNYFMEVDDDAWGYSPDQIQVWAFHADWNIPTNSTFTRLAQLSTAAFDSNMCSYSRNCVPQPGTGIKLDAISDRLMYRLQYRNVGSSEAWVVNHTVDVNGANLAGVRWYELRKNGSGLPEIVQQGTYAPADSLHRWMASAAMDKNGNIALAFNTSSGTVSPSVRYTARLAGDPAGQMTQGEADVVVGAGSQTSTSSRWGDYSMLGVDPVDGCTFWATLEYTNSKSTASWRTRVAAFSLPGCASAPPPSVPEPPTGLTVPAVSSSRVDLSWQDNSNNETRFEIRRSNTTLASVGPDVTSYSDTTVRRRKTYTYSVRACNANGCSAYSNSVTVRVP